MSNTSGLERKNNDLMDSNIKELKADHARRVSDGDKEVETASQDAAGYLRNRAVGRVVSFGGMDFCRKCHHVPAACGCVVTVAA